jgi:hypothetical protein
MSLLGAQGLEPDAKEMVRIERSESEVTAKVRGLEELAGLMGEGGGDQ